MEKEKLLKDESYFIRYTPNGTWLVRSNDKGIVTFARTLEEVHQLIKELHEEDE